MVSTLPQASFRIVKLLVNSEAAFEVEIYVEKIL